jgi:hypothetical protein
LHATAGRRSRTEPSFWRRAAREVEGLAEEDLPDVDAIEKQLAEADDVNAAVRPRSERIGGRRHAGDAKARVRRADRADRALDEKKADAIAAAKMPIDGLAFDDSGVTYRGVPFKQCSAAEQLRVSLAMAMAMNPKIRVVRITDGSLLDSRQHAADRGDGRRPRLPGVDRAGRRVRQRVGRRRRHRGRPPPARTPPKPGSTSSVRGPAAGNRSA